VRRVAIYERRDGWEIRVYAGVDPVTGKQRRISRQIQGSRRKAEKEETRLKAAHDPPQPADR
jgi:integrase